MADYTLVANTPYSALSPTPTGDDRILLNGFVLTINVTTIACAEITAAGNAGTIEWSSASATYTFSSNAEGGRTILQAGTVSLWTDANNVTRTIANCDIRAGSVIGAHGINNSRGTLTNCTINGGSASGAHGINASYATPTNCIINGGSASAAHGINNIYGTPTNCTINGGSVSEAYGIGSIYGAPTNCTINGGSVSGAHGINTIFGTPTNCTINGGSVSGASGINTNFNILVNLVSGIISDNAGAAIRSAGTRGSGRFGSIMIRGSLLRCTLPDHQTIWHIGAFHPSAVIQGTPTIIELWDTGSPKLSTGIREKF